MIKKLQIIFLFLIPSLYTNAQMEVLGADSTNFEVNGALAVINSSGSNIWEVGLPAKTFFGVAHSAPYAIMTDISNPYPVNNLSTFTVSYDSSEYGTFPDAYIGFWHKLETDTLKDGGFVEISVDSGATWVNVLKAYTIGIPIISPQNFYSETDTIRGNIPAFSGRKNNWEYSKVFLQWIIPVIHEQENGFQRELYNTQRIMFRFNFKSDGIQSNKAGWIIDNIEIGYTDIGSGIKDIKNPDLFEVHLFPNPMEDRSIIQIVSKDYSGLKLNLYNSNGQLISSNNINSDHQFIIKKNNLTSGIYFYTVIDKEGQTKTGKLIIK
jgi:hypothetical protein